MSSSTLCIFHDSHKLFSHLFVCFGFVFSVGGFLQMSDDPWLFIYLSNVPKSWLEVLHVEAFAAGLVQSSEDPPLVPGVVMSAKLAGEAGRVSVQNDFPLIVPYPPPLCWCPPGHALQVLLLQKLFSCVLEVGRRLSFKIYMFLATWLFILSLSLSS